jgi:hypothetical protein
MQEQHPPEESIRDQTLKKFRSDRNVQSTARKRKVSTGLVIVNLAIIVVLYIFYTGNKENKSYLSTSFNYRGATFRFSLLREKKAGEFICYLTTRAAGKEAVNLRFQGGLADLVVLCGTDVVVSTPFGKDLAELTLRPGESDIRKQSLDPNELLLFAQNHPDRVVMPGRSLLQFGKPRLPLTAEIRIHTEQPVSTSIQFMYEVEQ